MVDCKTKNRFVSLMRQVLPRYERHQYKGNSGKVAIVGGSEVYTGAPYFAAMAALRTGSELSRIYCPKEAILPIKSYSPEIMVQDLQIDDELKKEALLKQVVNLSTSVVIGPGMGREYHTFDTLSKLMTHVGDSEMKPYLILDADILWMITQNLSNF